MHFSILTTAIIVMCGANAFIAFAQPLKRAQTDAGHEDSRQIVRQEQPHEHNSNHNSNNNNSNDSNNSNNDSNNNNKVRNRSNTSGAPFALNAVPLYNFSTQQSDLMMFPMIGSQDKEHDQMMRALLRKYIKQQQDMYRAYLQSSAPRLDAHESRH